MIDQTQLVHDVLSLRGDFLLRGAEDVLAYRWVVAEDGQDVAGKPVATWQGLAWVGVE